MKEKSDKSGKGSKKKRSKYSSKKLSKENVPSHLKHISQKSEALARASSWLSPEAAPLSEEKVVDLFPEDAEVVKPAEQEKAVNLFPEDAEIVKPAEQEKAVDLFPEDAEIVKPVEQEKAVDLFPEDAEVVKPVEQEKVVELFPEDAEIVKPVEQEKAVELFPEDAEVVKPVEQEKAVELFPEDAEVVKPAEQEKVIELFPEDAEVVKPVKQEKVIELFPEDAEVVKPVEQEKVIELFPEDAEVVKPVEQEKVIDLFPEDAEVVKPAEQEKVVDLPPDEEVEPQEPPEEAPSEAIHFHVFPIFNTEESGEKTSSATITKERPNIEHAIITEEKIYAKSCVELASDYALPTSDAGTITEEVVSEDWKEKKIASCKKKLETPPPLKPYKTGTVLEKRYEVIEILREDADSVLYKVKDLKAEGEEKQIKSIKEIMYIPPKNAPENITADTLRQLDRMTSFLSDVDHPNLSRIYDHFSAIEKDNSGRFFMVTEFIEGNTLEKLLKEAAQDGKPLPVKTIFAIMEKLCEALDYLHNKKPFPIGFGDLKPSNIMLSLDGAIKFINYGVGTFFETDEDGNMSSRGTLGYSAPEQMGMDFTNTKADIYALGVTCYYMLTGVNPEEHPYEFKPLRKHKRFVSEKVQRFIDRCLQVHSDDRPDIKAVKKLIEKMDYQELDVASLKEKMDEIKKEKEKEPEPEQAPPPPTTQEKTEEFITEFKVQNPFIASSYGVISIGFLLVILILGIISVFNYIANLPRLGKFLFMSSSRSVIELNLDKYTFRNFSNMRIPLGPMAYSSGRRVLYTASSVSSYLYEMSPNSGDIQRKIKVGQNPSCILLSPDGNTVYVTNSGSNNIYVINAEKFEQKRSPAGVGRGPAYACISPLGDKIFIVDDIDERISFFDTTDYIVTNFLNFSGKKPKGVAADKDNLYVCLSSSNELAVVDIKTLEIKKRIPVDVNPLAVLVADKDLYVIDGKGGAIEVISKNNFSPGKKKFLGFQGQNAVLSEEKYIYILGVNPGLKNSSTIGLYDISSGDLVKRLNYDSPLNSIVYTKLK